MSWQTAMKRLGEEINTKLVDQFVLQGHKMTGAFEGSLEVLPDDTGVTGMGNTYGIYVNIGVKADRMKFPFAKARIAGLTRFVEFRKGISGKPAEQIAKAIIGAWLRDGGMPTKASSKYSDNGKRTDFIDDAIEQVDVAEILFQEFVSVIDTQKNVTGRK